jgi:hypothetical protein
MAPDGTVNVAVTKSGVLLFGASEVMLYEPPEELSEAFPTVIVIAEPSAEPDADSNCAV